VEYFTYDEGIIMILLFGLVSICTAKILKNSSKY